MMTERWAVQVRERPAAVERVLGTLRRRAVDVRDLSVARASADTLVVVATVRVGHGLGTRVCAELEASPDIVRLDRTRAGQGGRTARPGGENARHAGADARRGDENLTSESEPGDDMDEHATDAHATDENRLYEGAQADPDVLRERCVAVIGYGSQGHAHALNLRDAGISVVVGLHHGSASAARARAAGLTVMSVEEAARESDLVSLLIPDPVAPEVYRFQILPHLTPGKALLLAHGFNVHYGEVEAPEGVDVILVAPKSPGDMLRREYRAGRGVPALIGVHQDGTGQARALALAYADALGCTRAGVLETTFAAETETDLFGEQAVLCGGFTSLVKAGFETLVDAGYDPRLAYFECLHELKLIVDLAYAKGLSGMRAEVSDTAEYGDYVSGDLVIGKESRAAMRAILDRVRSGEFARDWIEEWRSGGACFRKMREKEGDHAIDAVGVGLRGRMAWLAEETPAT